MARFSSPASNNTVNKALIRCSPCRTMCVNTYTVAGSYSFTVPSHCSRGPGFGWPGITAVVIGAGGGGPAGVSCSCICGTTFGPWGFCCAMPIGGLVSTHCGTAGNFSCFRNAVAGGGGGGCPLSICVGCSYFLCGGGLTYPSSFHCYCGNVSVGQVWVRCYCNKPSASTATVSGRYIMNDWTGDTAACTNCCYAYNTNFSSCGGWGGSNLGPFTTNGTWGSLCWCITETTSSNGTIYNNLWASGSALCVCLCGTGPGAGYSSVNVYGGTPVTPPGGGSAYCDIPGRPGFGGIGFGQDYICCTTNGCFYANALSIIVTEPGREGRRIKTQYGQGVLSTGSLVSLCVGSGGTGGQNGWPVTNPCWSSSCFWGLGCSSAIGAIGFCHNKHSIGGNGVSGAVFVCWWN